MEGVLPPSFPQPSFEAMGAEMGGMFRAFKDPEQGRQLVVEQNMFVEQILPGFVNRPLGSEATEVSRGSVANKNLRTPVLVWPRQVPIAGEPADEENQEERYIVGRVRFVVVEPTRSSWCRKHTFLWCDLEPVDVEHKSQRPKPCPGRGQKYCPCDENEEKTHVPGISSDAVDA